MPEHVDLAADRDRQAAARQRRPALGGVQVGEPAGQFLVADRPVVQRGDQQRGLAHRHGEVRLAAVVRPDERRGPDVPAHRGVLGHQPARPGQHQGGAAASHRAHLLLGEPAERVQREQVEFLVPFRRHLAAPAEQARRLPHQRRRDVVPGGQPQPGVGVPQHPAQRRQRLAGQHRRLQQPGHDVPGHLGPLARVPVRPFVDALGADPAQPRVGVPVGAGQPAVHQRRPPGLPPAHADLQVAAGHRELDRRGAGLIGRALVRPHLRGRAPGQQVGVGRGGGRGVPGLPVGRFALSAGPAEGRQDLLGLFRGALLRVPLHPGQREQPGQRPRDRDMAVRRYRPAGGQRVPQELLQAQQRHRLQTAALGQPSKGGARVTGQRGILPRQGLQSLRLSHHAASLHHDLSPR